MDYLKKHRDLHVRLIEPYIGKPDGSSSDEIAQLEIAVGYELPVAYKQYLSWMGSDRWGIFQGSDCFRWNVLDNTKYLPRWLEKLEVSFQLPDEYLAWFCHQGYTYAWFDLSENIDDPQVWWFTEVLLADPDAFDPPKEPKPQTVGKFSDWLFELIQANANLLPKTAEFHRAFRQSWESGKTITISNGSTVSVENPSSDIDENDAEEEANKN